MLQNQTVLRERSWSTIPDIALSASLVEVLRHRVWNEPQRPAYTFLDDGEAESAQLRYCDLDQRARAIAVHLRAAVQPGDRALLLYPPGLDFVAAFLGCLYAGTVAVPTFPPRSRRADARLRGIARDAEPGVVLTDSQLLSAICGDARPSVPTFPGPGNVRVIATDRIPTADADGWREPQLSPEDTAFLQYTSGSTAAPKGVIITHGNLVHNQEMIRQVCGHTEKSVIVSWLPPYHDMGLIAGLLQPIYAGGRCVLMSPTAFLQKPVRWLDAVTRYRGNTSGGPNFAYDLCVRKVTAEDRRRLDLSSWRVAFNGAEPVRTETVERFARVFAGCGFDRRASYPCYGLAEATLLVTGGVRDEEPQVEWFDPDALEAHRVAPVSGMRERVLVSCGHPRSGQRLRIVDPDTRCACAPHRVGEIWLAGPSVARGYWQRPEETARDFGARLADDERAGPFLRTGDLGFLWEGELFVTGRLKDLIIIRGRNHYPQDLELAACKTHALLRAGGGAAFAVEAEGEERLVIVNEIRREAEAEVDVTAVSDAVRRAIAEEYEVHAWDVVLIPAGTLPKTSSGKVQRRACRAAYLRGELTALGSSRVDPVETTVAEPALSGEEIRALPSAERRPHLTALLRARLAQVLGIDPAQLDPTRALTALGLDSLRAVELSSALEEQLGTAPSQVRLLEGASLQELVEELMAGLESGVERMVPAPAPATAAEHPLSRGQRALWFLEQLTPGTTAFMLAGALRVRGELDREALDRALARLVARHPALRTTFHEAAGEPRQAVRDAMRTELVEEAAADRDLGALRERLAEFAYRPFDVEHGPLFRLALLRCGAGEQVLLVTIHHAISDLWSIGLFLDELEALYGEETGGPAAQLPELPQSYADYVHGQEAMLASERGRELRRFWQERLGGEILALDLPTDRPRPAAPAMRGALESLRLDSGLLTAVEALGQRHGATLFMTLTAALEVLLHRTTAADEVLVGAPTTGRGTAELGRVIGYFVNPVVLRAELAGDPACDAFLERTRHAVLAAFAHQDCPFPLLAERLQPERDASRAPIFQAMLVLQQTRRPGLAAAALGEEGALLELFGLPCESLRLPCRDSQLDLTLYAAPWDDGLGLALEYAAELFDATSMRRLLGHFRALLRGMTSEPRRRLSELALLNAPERAQLLVEWNDTGSAGPPACLHELVEAQVRRTSTATAVVCGKSGARLTYRQLERRSAALAARLRALGVGPEVRVGVCMPRTPELVVAILGVLRAGGTYVPIDPEYPDERRVFMLEDSRARVLVSHSGLSVGKFGNTLFLDQLSKRAPAGAAAGTDVDPRNLSHLIYTSGSTGLPKGVAIRHAAAAAMVRWALASFAAEELRGVLLSTSVCFDISVFEIFVPLACGGAVIVAENALELPSLAVRDQVTLINTVPSAMTELVRQGAIPPSVRTVNLAGEPLKRELVDGVYATGTVDRVYNLYGPSEDTTYTTWTRVPRSGEVTIGRPLAGTRVYVLDRAGRPVPPGAIGELTLAGEGLARGYLGRPALTAERFIPVPDFPLVPVPVPVPDSGWAGGQSAERSGTGTGTGMRGNFLGLSARYVGGTRMYRTGDLVRHRPDGELEFIGRRDHQVKVRGYRIELGEIESALLAHPAVHECVVVVRDEADRGPVLAAYVAGAEEKPQTEELRELLHQRLPEPMVPAAFVVLDRLPLLPNGKVNRRALPAPDWSAVGHRYQAPRTPEEELLAGIWAEVLHLDRVGVADRFFELGGHSLLATQVLSRVRRAFGVDLPVRALFEAPTVAELGRRIAAARGARPTPPIRPLPRQGYPVAEADVLSFAQERLWFLDQLESGSAFYNIPLVFRLTGPLGLGVFRAAIDAIVRRHESLRTTFGDRGGRPYQRIAAELELTVPLIDVSGLEPRTAGRRVVTTEIRRPFDLSRGPLVRVELVRVAPGEHLMILCCHHIVFDGWSAQVFLGELVDAYERFAAGRRWQPPQLRVQYADYAAWQREWLQGAVLAEQLAYWREQLAGVSGLELPTDRPRPPVETFRGTNFETALSEPLTAGLHALAVREGVTVYMVLLAAFFALLRRYSGHDAAVGSPIANRGRAEVEGLMGFFANTLVLRCDLSDAPSFGEILARVRETCLDGYAHQDLPFEKLVEEIQPQRDMSRNPLFQVMLVLENQPGSRRRASDLTLELVQTDPGTAKFDLIFFWWEEDEGRLDGLVEYNTDLFDGTTVRRLLGHYVALLRAMAGDAGTRPDLLPVLSPAERHHLLCEWNDTRTPGLGGRPVHRWVEERARLSPEAVALVDGARALSYRELDARANQLAWRLRKLGVGPERLVGICVERSAEMLVGFLAVLKAGGAGVALDPAYPKDRISAIIRDAAMTVLVTQDHLLAFLPEHAGENLRLTPDWSAFAAEPTDDPGVGVFTENPIYAIYTSGSTGQPKGILVTHGAFANLVDWQLSCSALARRAKTVEFATFGFCVSFQEMFTAWCSGGSLVMADEMTRRDIDGLAAFLAGQQIERLHLPFAALKQLAESAADHDVVPSHLKEVITAGEQLQVSPSVRGLFERLPGCSLHNQYGASETHVVSAHTLFGGPDRWRTLPPAGRPVANVRIHLLDAGMAPVPVGVTGWLYTAGACEARGYLNDPVTTAQKFVPDPFSPGPGGRLYRTGDLARHLADGEIEYFGRGDDQVKIRGFRVELGEVETALARQPRVRDAAVLARDGGAVGTRLVAYVVPAGSAPEGELRAALETELPEYMLPSAFVFLEGLPLNANGKLDREALPEPEWGRGGSEYVAPRTPTEEVLAGIWAEVLGFGGDGGAPVSAEDNFFELGGHSLLATQVTSRLREAFAVEVALRELFSAPTLSTLAAKIDALRHEQEGVEGPPIVPVGRDRDLPPSFAQERLWFLDLLDPGKPQYNICGAVHLAGDLDAGVFHRSLNEIVRRHEALRTTFMTRDDALVQLIAPRLHLELPRVELGGLGAGDRETEARRLAAREARRSFDLARGPLVRVRLLRLAASEHILVLNMHHAISDGWSLGVLLRELRTLGAGVEPVPLPVQYADYAVWQRRWLGEEHGVAERELVWWREELAGARGVLELPTDRPRPAMQSLRGAQRSVRLEPALVAELTALGRKIGATLFMVLLAGLDALLHRVTAADDLLIGSPVAGRNRQETEGLIGLFVNTLVLRARVAGELPFRELLARVRTATLGAYDHQDLPFEQLVEALDPKRDLSRSPLFQVMLALQNEPLSLDLPGLVLTMLEVDPGTARFDLELHFWETAGGLVGFCTYDQALFDASTVERLLRQYRILLEGIIAEPDAALGTLPWLSRHEEQQLLVEWNVAGRSAAPAAAVHELVLAQVARTPGATAVVCAATGAELSYAELEGGSAAVAARLRALGVGPEVRVGVCLPRTPELVVALLGVLRAGGAYVPIDPSYPADRQAFMLEDSQARVLVSHSSLREKLPADAEVLFLDQPAPETACVPVEVDPEALAYVIYTSGSTGVPKGVAIRHAAAVEMVRWALDVFDRDELRGVLASTSVCFDISVFEIFVPLACGGSVIVAENALELRTLAGRDAVTLINTVPSAMAELVRQGGVPESVRTVNLAGEPLQRKLVDAAYAIGSVERVLNLYGPSEDTTYSTWVEVPRDGGRVTIGRPIAGTRGWVLDRAGRPVAMGVVGELHLAGEGLARGYLDRPALTAEQFIPEPPGLPGGRGLRLPLPWEMTAGVSAIIPPGERAGVRGLSRSGTRMVRTGDLVRYRPDGELEFLGRIDHQVKVRGFRIELGEIETALLALEGVRQCVVVARDEEDTGAQLVAYVVGEGLENVELAAPLRRRLPDYMVPSTFVELTELPVLPNGKVDRKALPTPERKPVAEYAAPRSPSEEVLAAIWAEVLGGRDRIGIDDDFFQLGGHSLLGTRVVSRVREAFGVELPLRRLFEVPTVAGLAAWLDQAPRSKSAAPPLAPVSRDQELPLSFAQERLWFIDQLAPGNPVYNLPVALRLRGRLPAAVLKASFDELVRRHEVLRTCFASVEGRAVQDISSPRSQPLPQVDLRALSAVASEAEARRLTADEAARPFDLARGPVLRMQLVILADDEQLLLVTVHHIAADGWSTAVLVREVAELARAVVASPGARTVVSPLAELPIQYADFAFWQRRWLPWEVRLAELAWWREQLSGALQRLDLPADRPRPAMWSFRGRSRPIAFSPALSGALTRLSHRQGATLFMTLLAAFQAFLARTTGQHDVLVGSPIAGRNRKEIEALIGFFVNTLVLRTDLGGDPEFGELLARVRRATLESYAHQDLPFEHLVDGLAEERDTSSTPLVQVVFGLQNTPAETLELPGVSITPVITVPPGARFDLTVLLIEGPQGLEGLLEYSTDLFDDATIARLAAHFTTLLADVVRDPRQRLSELSWFTAAERQQLVVEWNDTVRPYPHDQRVSELFEAQVARTPDAVAVEYGEPGELVTYAELNRRANRLAHHLRARGVANEDLVGLCLERSLRTVVAILAILKAGGAYLPIDLDDPPQRVATLLADAGAPVVITASGPAAELPPITAEVVLLDEHAAAIARGSAANPEPAPGADAENLAYAIYTSGSTGLPKGVAVTHRAIARLVFHGDYVDFQPDDRVAQVSNTSFDAATFELWGSLLHGGRLVGIRKQVTLDPPVFAATLGERGITAMFLTAALFNQIAAVEPTAFRGMRHLLVGGEALDPHWIRTVLTRGAPERLLNGYGPTESTTFAAWYEIREVPEGARSVPIGVPLGSTELYVVDRNLSPVPIGVEGELCIAGHGLARGYLNRPSLTAERFVPGPHCRLYRTGDRVRALADGAVEFLGRLDFQVKLRGFRIEPGEIEAALGRHPGVRKAAVVARREADRTPRLVAWVVPEDPAAGPAAAELREFLKEKLPAYMVPAAIVLIEAMPLTATGKLDRRALERCEPAWEPAAAIVAPRTPVEEELVRIWTEVLGGERVGVEDNFFASGGDSILSIQVVSRARVAGIHLSPGDVFRHQTIAELATVATTAEPVAAVEREDVTEPVPLLPIHHWFLERRLRAPHHFNQAVLLELAEPLDPRLLAAALGTLVAHHDALRLRLRRADAQWELIPDAAGGEVPLTVVDLEALSPPAQQTVLTQVAAAIHGSLDLDRGPLTRMALVKQTLTPQPPPTRRHGRLLWVVHHLAVDGVSWRLLVPELEWVYRWLAGGREPSLPAETTSLRGWSRRLREYARSEALLAQLPGWLAAEGTRFRLPQDHPGGANTFASRRTVTVELEAEETRSLLREVPAAYRTQIRDVLLAALAWGFAETLGTSALHLDLEGHGREDLFPEVDLSRTVGWFTSIYPAGLDLGSVREPGAVLKRIKEQLRAIPDGGLGYGVLRWLSPGDEPRALRTRWPAEMSFNYLGQFDAELAGSSLFRLASETSGPPAAPWERRPYLLEIAGSVTGGRLRLVWGYSRNLHRRATVERWALGFLRALRELMRHCLQPEAGGHTPSDFPLAALDQAELDGLLGRRRIEDLYPLSPLQRGMLFHTLLAPELGEYVEQLSCELAGDLDAAAFREAWQWVVDRHPILRTSFLWEGLVEPLQGVERKVELPWTEEDWRGRDPSARAQALDELLEADRRRGFDLTNAPLLRVSLVRTDEDTCHFILCFHHILLDGWSQAWVLQEVFDAYRKLRRHEVPRAAPVPSYRGYIDWLTRRDPAAADSYWRRTLQGFTTPTRLAESSPEQTGADDDFRNLELTLEPALGEILYARAAQRRLTVHTLVQGAWALLVARTTGRHDVVYGTTVAGRPAELRGVESIVGLFINTVPVRVTVPPREIPARWLDRLQRQQAELREHEHSALDQIRGLSELPADAELFDHILVFENYPVDASLRQSVTDLRIRAVRSFERTNYPLAVAVVPGEPMRVRMLYDGRSYEPTAIGRMLGHFRNLLGGVAEAVAGQRPPRLGEIPMLSPAERHHLLAEWNDVDTDYPSESIHELFKVQARRTPDAVALVGDHAGVPESWTYAELDRRTDVLAAHLRRRGVGPEVMVAVSLERSPELILAILGVLKAGGGYLPLEPALPRERYRTILDDAQAAVVVTRRGVVGDLDGQEVIHLEDLPQAGADSLPSTVGPENLAYVMVTSGSTGVPKMVAVPHRAVVRLVRDTNYLRFASDDVFLHLAPIAFDASTLEVWGPLLNGGRLVVYPAGRTDPQELGRTLCRHRVTTLWLTAGLFHLMVDERAADLAGVKHLLAGGDVLSPEHVRRMLAEPGERELINGYGPTENTTFTCCHPMRGAEAVTAPVAIGRPIANTRISILDRRLQSVPMGALGELCIAGDGLARGYLARPELTAEIFVPSPAGRRLYRTGDLARYRPDGTIEFAGRIDRQVKLRGFRIEPGEIEVVLGAHPGVEQVAVVACDFGAQDRRLVAFLVACGEASPELTDELRRRARARLPEYMVPAHMTWLEALPLTPNGKLDRAALGRRALEEAGTVGSESEVVAPRDEVERTLAAIWSETLGVERVSIHDSFFDLGGHSLLAVRLMGEIRRRFGTELPLATLFQESTVERLARLLRDGAGPALDLPLVEIQPGDPVRPRLHCIHAGGGNVLSYHDLARELGDVYPVYGIQARGLLAGEEPPRRTVEEMADAYLDAVTGAQPAGPYFLLGHCFGGLVAYEMAVRLADQGREVALVALLDTELSPADARVPEGTELILNELGRLIELTREELEGLPLEEQHALAVEKLKVAGIAPSDYTAADLRRSLAVVQGSRYAWRDYQPPGLSSGDLARVVLFRAGEELDRGGVEALGWDEVVGERLKIRVVPGDHATLIGPPHISVLARQLRRFLELQSS